MGLSALRVLIFTLLGFNTLCVSTKDATEDGALIRRKRFNWGVAIQTVSLVTGTTTVYLSIHDYATDGAVFYPSIDVAKSIVKEKKQWIDDNRGTLESVRQNYKKAYETYTDTKIHTDIYMKAKSVVVQQLQQEAFEARRKKYLSNHIAASFLENGLKIPSKNESFAISMDVQKALFWTGTSLNIVMQAYSATKLVETLRMGQVIAKQSVAIQDINDFMNSEGYRPTGRGRLPGPPRQATSAPAKVGRIRRIGNFMKRALPKAFRSNTHLKTHIVDDGEADVSSLSANKVAVGLAAFSLALQTAGTVLQVLAAKAKKHDWDEKANYMTNQEKQLKKALREFPEQELIMEEITDDMANIVQYLLEQDGVICDVDRENIEAIVRTLKDRTVETLRAGEKHMARYQGLKELIMLLGGHDAKYIYNKLVNEMGRGDMKDEIVDLLKKGGKNVGTWNEWKGKGACVLECGIPHRRMDRTCASGDDCLGISEGTEICQPFLFNKTEFKACEKFKDRDTLGPTVTKDPLSFALPELCNKSRTPSFQYYTITNMHTGLVMAINKDNWQEGGIIVEKKNLSPNSNHNQLWRKEPSTKAGHYQLVCKLYGRSLKIEIGTEKSIFDWNVSEQGTIKGESVYLTVDDESCAVSSSQRFSKTVPNAVVYNFESTKSSCHIWEITLFEESGLELTTVSPQATTSMTTTAPSPRTISEFLQLHNLYHLYSNFVDNGIDMDFLPELSMAEMKEIGINSARDRIKLSRAVKKL